MSARHRTRAARARSNDPGRSHLRAVLVRRRAALALGVIFAVVAAPGAAQQGDGSSRAPAGKVRVTAAPTRTARAPVVDGRLDDEAWGTATPISGFVQREPEEGRPVSERTEVRLLMDDKALYVGAWLFDSDPDGIVLGERIRDADLERGDYFGIILDTYRDRQNGFIFSTNPAGIEYDAQVVKEGEGGGVFLQGQNRQQAGAMGGLNVNWDGSWHVATSRDGAGWYAEMRIPFSTLRYGSRSEQVWGMNLVRRIRRRNEEAYWSPVPRQFGLMRLSQAGDLQGVRVPAQRTATVTPFVLGSAERTYASLRGSTEYPREVGGDAKLTFGSMTLDVTVNTDFAQVEVDEQRTNLTRFPLFFPEKRPFFLENAGLFSAGTPQAADLFFTRRIGIVSGKRVPILGGGRLSGKVAGLGVGVMQIFTDGVRDLAEEQAFSVARVSRELPNRSRLGAIFVQRRATHDGGNYNRTLGVDARAGVGDAWTVDAWVARTRTPGVQGGDAGAAFLLTHASQVWPGRIRFMQVGANFNPEVGFVDRRGYRMVELNQERIIRFPSVPWLRETNPHATYRRYEKLDGLLETGYLHLDWELKFAGGGRFGPETNMYQEGLRKPFQVAPGVTVPVGSYTWWTNAWDYGSDPSRPFSFLGKAEFGGFYTGRKYGGNVTLTYRRGEMLSSSLLVDHNVVRLPQGDFETTLLGLRLAYFFTPSIFVQSLLQYSDQADTWSANVRFAWLGTAGTGLYVVYNDSRNAARLGTFGEPVHRGFIVKYARQVTLF